jgi:hypothetical protein
MAVFHADAQQLNATLGVAAHGKLLNEEFGQSF